MRLPGRFMPHTVTVEPFVGDGAYGPVYGDPATVRCLIDDTRRMVRDTDGVEVVSETTLFADVDANVPVQSKVTVRGRDTWVIATKVQDGGGLATPNHLEASLA